MLPRSGRAYYLLRAFSAWRGHVERAVALHLETIWKIKALHLRVVVTPFPGGAARAPERGTRWPTLHDISNEAYYVMASAAWTRCIGMGAPTQAHRFLRIGRGTTMAVTTDMAQGAKPAKFDTLLTWAEEGRLALKKGLHDMADEKGCDEARQNFYRGLADRCDPLPLKEIPVALQLATTAFDDNDLATCPYKYKSVIPVTDPPPASPPAVTSWPEGAAFPCCSLDCLTPECHKACDDWLTRNNTWHASGGNGKRPEALCFGFDGFRADVRGWFEAGGVIDFCTEPPSILVEAGQCYEAPVNGARAAEMFANSTDQHMTHLWQHGVAVQGEPSNAALLFVPNLMSVYPDGVAPLAAEEDGFRAQGWTRTLAQPRDARHLGIPCLPFLSVPVGCVDKKGTETKRVITDCGFPHDDFYLTRCNGGKLERSSVKYVSPNVRHGPKRPSKGTPIATAAAMDIVACDSLLTQRFPRTVGARSQHRAQRHRHGDDRRANSAIAGRRLRARLLPRA